MREAPIILPVFTTSVPLDFPEEISCHQQSVWSTYRYGRGLFPLGKNEII